MLVWQQVGVGADDRSALAEVSIVNFDGDLVYHRYVKPQERVTGMPLMHDCMSDVCGAVADQARLVTDYRTKYSGIRPRHLEKAATFAEVQKEVAQLTQNCILVGHALSNDLDVRAGGGGGAAAAGAASTPVSPPSACVLR